MNTNYKELAAWYKFASTGKVCDYLQYRNITQENENEAEHGRIDNTGATDGRG